MAEKKIPVATYVLGTIGLAALVRGLWNPHRGLVRRGAVAHCSGEPSCAPTMGVACEGPIKVYSVGAGRVVFAEGDTVHVLVSNEPVVLYYRGLKPSVKEGSYVMRGRKIGECSGPLEFGVYGLSEDGRLAPIEPAAWLASRGYEPAVRATAERGLWCEGGRRITIPQEVHATCSLHVPEEPRFALLPVSVKEA